MSFFEAHFVRVVGLCEFCDLPFCRYLNCEKYIVVECSCALLLGLWDPFILLYVGKQTEVPPVFALPLDID